MVDWPGTPGPDHYDGDNVDDRLHGAGGNDTINGMSGDDHIFGDSGNDYLRGGIGWDTVRGGTGDDRIYGDSQYDYLLGESGDDTLDGGSGNDELDGGDGSDRLNGGAGSDGLRGGPGADAFIFSTLRDAQGDSIADFNWREFDYLNVRGIDANSLRTGNQDFWWIGDAQFSGVGQLRYYHADGNTYIAGNTDRDSAAEFTITLWGNRGISSDNIVL